jgi:Flp pilus assembly protein TadG
MVGGERKGLVTLRQIRGDQGVVTLNSAGSATRDGRRRESGQVAVLFALLLPMILVLGSIVISIGNWYVHQKHLQTQVDAAAFAVGTTFSGASRIRSRPTPRYGTKRLRTPATRTATLQP